jgi:hypothetical protein
MASLLVVFIVAAGVVLWTRTLRQNRRRWLARLDLPGLWVWQDDDGELELGGSLDSGDYRIREGEQEEAGRWRLEGHSLILVPESTGTTAELDLRFFKEGTIGVHGPGRERRVYVKKRANVIPLRRPA